jgi:hypothetical protein
MTEQTLENSESLWGEIPEIEIHIATENVLRVTVPPDEPEDSAIYLLPPAHPSTPPPRLEVNGSILYPAGSYQLLGGSSFSIFAWQGGTVRIRGSLALRLGLQKATTSNYRTFMELHCILHLRREFARSATTLTDRVGPRVVICGGRGVGKHSLMVSLANWAARLGFTPTVVDGSVETQSLALPGSIGIAAWDFPTTIDEGSAGLPVTVVGCGLLSPHSTTGCKDGSLAHQMTPLGVSGASALAINPYPTGPAVNPIYTRALTQAVDIALQRVTSHLNDAAGPSGLIILLPQLPRRQGFEVIQGVIDQADATHVFCFGDDFVVSQLSQRYGTANLNDPQIALKPGSKGCDSGRAFMGPKGFPMLVENVSVTTGPVQRLGPKIREEQRKATANYFLGSSIFAVQPLMMRKPIAWCDFFRFCTRRDATTGSMGGAKNVTVERCKLQDLLESHRVVNSVVPVYELPPGGGEVSILTSTVCCFIHLKDLDRTELTFLSTVPEKGLPARSAILLSELTWVPA